MGVVTVEGRTVVRVAGGQRKEVGFVYPTTRGWQSVRGGWFSSRFCKSRHAALRELLADQGIDHLIDLCADLLSSADRRSAEINTTHVAIEQTLRERHGHPSYIADLDGPGRFRAGLASGADDDTCARCGRLDGVHARWCEHRVTCVDRTPASGADQPTLRDQLAEQAWGVLVAAGMHHSDAVTAAHAIARNQLPLVERAKAEELEEAAARAAALRSNAGGDRT